jgi:hypothetical protein
MNVFRLIMNIKEGRLKTNKKVRDSHEMKRGVR